MWMVSEGSRSRVYGSEESYHYADSVHISNRHTACQQREPVAHQFRQPERLAAQGIKERISTMLKAFGETRTVSIRTALSFTVGQRTNGPRKRAHLRA